MLSLHKHGPVDNALVSRIILLHDAFRFRHLGECLHYGHLGRVPGQTSMEEQSTMKDDTWVNVECSKVLS